jgi:hypothetical protein
VPLPEASTFDALNQHIMDACLENRQRTILGRSMTIGQASELERENLLPLAEDGFPIPELLYPLVVDGKGRVKVKTNWYSTPLWPGLRVMARLWPLTVEIVRDGEVAAKHPRCYGRGHQILDLEHYLDVLERKPGAMAGSTPLQQWLIAAVTEALRLGLSDAAAVLHLLRMPDPEQRRQYAVALAEELLQFERPMPVMDNYDLLLANPKGAIQ